MGQVGRAPARTSKWDKRGKWEPAGGSILGILYGFFGEGGVEV